MAASQNTGDPEKQKERPSALRSIIAGSTAGAVEIGMLHRSPNSQNRALLIPLDSYHISSRMYVHDLQLGVSLR